MNKVLSLISIFIIIAIIGAGLSTGLKVYDKNNLNGKAGEIFLKRGASLKSGYKKIEEGTKVFGEKGFEATGANTVTEVVVNYRSFDTLGEVTVLFMAATGVLALFYRRKRDIYFLQPNYVLKISSILILPFIVMLGYYIFIHGHLTPGGGFQGGVILAIATLLYVLSNHHSSFLKKSLKVLEGLSGMGYVVIGLLGIIMGGFFLYNFLPLGKVGDLFSAGIVPIVYILIGLKVGSEVSGIILDYIGEDE